MSTNRNSIWIVLVMSLFLSVRCVIAQEDSIATGVLKVRKPPVPSRYYVDISYSYSPAKSNFVQRLLQSDRKRKLPKDNDASLHPPEPVALPRKVVDSTRALEDSSFMIRFYEKEDRPANEFGWIDWMDQYEHYFQWNDTAGIDSAIFFYSVNTRGQVSVNAGADDAKDSSSTRLKENLLPYMKRLWIWYPAIWIVDDRGKQKKVNCIVTVKVYAVREDKVSRMPLKIVD